MSQLDELDFQQPAWSLYQAIHWIAFDDGEAPADEDAGDKFENAQIDLLKNWIADRFKGHGRRDANAAHEEIPIIKLGGNPNDALEMFDPLSNAIYNSKNLHGEPLYRDVFFYRVSILAVWAGSATKNLEPPLQAARPKDWYEKVVAWFVDEFVPKHQHDKPNPTWKSSWVEAKKQFPGWVIRDVWRDEIWRTNAPEAWHKRGRKPKP